MRYKERVKLQIPGTIANLVCGFDILGLAIDSPYDEMEVIMSPRKGVTIKHIDEYNLPEGPNKNVAGISLLSLLEKIEEPIGFDIIIKKNIKPGSGLGSSAASAAGAVYGANHLLGNPFSTNELIQFAMNGEKLASKQKHADNIAPCLMGGIVLIRQIYPLDVIKLACPDLYISIVHPQIEVKTAEARALLPRLISLRDATKQWGNIAGLVASLYTKDYGLMSKSLKDVIVEPKRSRLIPHLEKLKKDIRHTNAIGGGISGSGPSIFMISANKEDALEVAQVMRNTYTHADMHHSVHVSPINKKGVQIIDMS